MNKPNSLQSLRAILYTRVSTMGQVENGTSLAAQFAACLQKAEQIGAAVIAHFEDAGVSGAKYEERDGLQKAIAAIEEGRANVLICYDLSRYSRDSEHQLLIKRRIENAGGKLVFCTLSFEDNADGDLLFDITRAFPVWERRKIRERLDGGKQREAAEGRQPFRSRRPYGYIVATKAHILRGEYASGDEGHYFIMDDEAIAVRQMYEHFAAGMSLRQLCLWLNKSHYLTSEGRNDWRPNVVRRMLQNALYKGEAAVYKTKIVNNTRVCSDPEKWIRLDAPAVVGANLWEIVQGRFQENREGRGGRPNRRYPLSGIIFCPGCGRRMLFASDGKSKDIRYYRCRYSKPSDYAVSLQGIEKCSFPRRVRADRIESQVDRAIEAAATQPDKLTAALAAHNKRNAEEDYSEAEYERISKELDKLQERERRTVKAQIAGIASGADPGLYADEFVEIAEQRTRLQNCKRFHVEKRKERPQTDPEQTAAFVTEKMKRISELLSPGEIPHEVKNELLSHIIKEVKPDENRGCEVVFHPAVTNREGLTVTHISIAGTCPPYSLTWTYESAMETGLGPSFFR